MPGLLTPAWDSFSLYAVMSTQGLQSVLRWSERRLHTPPPAPPHCPQKFGLGKEGGLLQLRAGSWLASGETAFRATTHNPFSEQRV